MNLIREMKTLRVINSFSIVTLDDLKNSFPKKIKFAYSQVQFKKLNLNHEVSYYSKN